MDVEDSKRSASTVHAIVAIGVLALSSVSGDAAIQNTAQETAQATINNPMIFGEQSASVVATEPQGLNANKIELEKKFKELAQKWKAQVGGSSSVTNMVMNPAYLEIISYGENMIPFILKDLQEKPSHWFIALKTLVHSSPVKPEDAGNIKKMTEAWLTWGRENGKLS